MMLFNDVIVSLNSFILGWPFLLFILSVSIIITFALNFVQIRKFFTGWKLLLHPEARSAEGDMTPFEAFVNALSASVGNGSIAGMATAVYAGGPGAAFWVLVFGFLGMSLRYSEVFLSNYFAPISESGNIIGGPMIYLQKVPFGKALSYVFAAFLLFLGLATGNAMQANSIRLGFVHILPIDSFIVALALFLFIVYVVAGGARRIIEVSDKIVPVKVGLFFISAIIVLAYHYQSILPALKLIIAGAFYPQALAGGAAGLLVQHAMRYGILLASNATEAGLGTAAVLFGGTGSKEPVKNGIMSMISVFISANLVCFLVALMIIASGVWNNGQTSLNLTISAYETVFGVFGGWVVSVLAVSFGIGVLVAYAYISRACWLYLTKGRFEFAFNTIYCLMAFWGAMVQVDIVWNLTYLANAGLLAVNLFAMLWFLPLLRKTLRESPY